MSLTPIDSRLFKLVSKINSKQFSKLEELAEFMGVSTRTIQNYIKKLNQIMKSHDAKIVNVKKVGYKLVVEDKKKFIKLIEDYENDSNKSAKLDTAENRIAYIIEFLVNFNGFITIDELAYKMNVGRTTLVNDLKKVRTILKIYNIKLSGKQNSGIKISGSEMDIRFLILDYFYKGQGGNFNYKDINLYKNIKAKIMRIFSENKLHITDRTVKQTMDYIFIMLYRLKNHRLIKNIDRKYYDAERTHEYFIARQIAVILEKVFNCKLNKYEIIFLTLPLLGREAPINLGNITVRKNVKQLVEQIINEVNDNFGLAMKPENEIVKNLEYHLNFMLNRLIFNIGIENALLDDIKKNYPLPYEMAKLGARIIKQNYNLDTGEDEIGYIALYFQSYIEQNSSNSDNIKKVALVCGTGLGTAQLLKIKLNKMLSNKDIVIKTFSDANITRNILDDYDIVFTTVDLNLNTITPIVKVNALFNEDDLRKELDKTISLKKYNIKYVEDNLSILSIIIQPQFFFVLYRNNYFENLNDMLVRISTNPDIDEDFNKNVIKREIQSPTFLGNYIAMPHAVNKKGSRLSISIGILDKPIVSDGFEINIIILLIIPPEDKIDSEILIKAYEELLKIGQNKEIVQKMSQIRDYEGFKNILLEEVNL